MTSDATGTVCILFVDDDELILSSLRRALRAQGYAVLFTDNPEQALQLLRDHEIDIIVSDQTMPQMSGLELLAIVRRRHAQVVRVLLTGAIEDPMASDPLDDGQVQHRLEKPWDTLELRSRLKGLVDDVRRRRTPSRYTPSSSPRLVPGGAICLGERPD